MSPRELVAIRCDGPVDAHGAGGDDWLYAELDRAWLLAESCLRRLLHGELRSLARHPALGEVEALLRLRREQRVGVGAAAEPEEMAGALAALSGAVLARRTGTPLARLSSALGMTALEVEALMLAVAPHVDPGLADLFGLLRGTPVRRGVDPALIGDLLQLGRAERLQLLEVLDPERPLLGYRLLQAIAPESPEGYGSAAYRALQPTPDLLALLGGRGEPSPTLQPYARCLTAPGTLRDLVLDRARRQQLERLGPAVAGGAGTRPWLLLWGPAGAGKRTLAARLAASSKQALLAFDPTWVAKAAREELLRRAQRDALALGAALYVGPLRDLSGDDAAALAYRLQGHPGTVMFGVESFQAPLFRTSAPLVELEVALPSTAERVTLWERSLAGGGALDQAELAALARAYRLTPGEIASTATEALQLASGQQRGVAAGDLRAGIERRLRNELGTAAWRVDTKARLSGLVLEPDDRERVRELIDRQRYADRVFCEWGLGELIQRGLGTIALFSGPPGTGKTMLAGAIANELGLELYQVDLSQIYSRWVGETEKALGRVFDQAERAHAVLLFDEADSLLSRRTDVDSSNDRYANAAVNYLLQRLERYRGVAVLTTNNDAVLDPALQRRLSLHLRLKMPDAPERERLWRSLLPAAVAPLSARDFRALAGELELTGGYIRNVALRAAFLAARADGPIDLALLRHAAELELEDMGRLVMRKSAAVPQDEAATVPDDADTSAGGDRGAAPMGDFVDG